MIYFFIDQITNLKIIISKIKYFQRYYKKIISFEFKKLNFILIIFT